MGSPESEKDAFDDEKPQVDVTLSHGFWLGQTVVTQGQWEQLMGTTPWKGREFVKEGADYPAVYVSHGLLADGTVEPVSAMAFCRKLTASERAAGRLPDGWEYTLPTEAQWEYACRAGTTTRYSFGDNASLLGDYAWYDSNARDIGNEYAHAVGNNLPNPWGFHDLHGNVLEWVPGFVQRTTSRGPRPIGGSWLGSGDSGRVLVPFCQDRAFGDPGLEPPVVPVRLPGLPTGLESVGPGSGAPSALSGAGSGGSEGSSGAEPGGAATDGGASVVRLSGSFTSIRSTGPTSEPPSSHLSTAVVLQVLDQFVNRHLGVSVVGGVALRSDDHHISYETTRTSRGAWP